jgi:AcrR family transcriptional regulator
VTSDIDGSSGADTSLCLRETELSDAGQIRSSVGNRTKASNCSERTVADRRVERTRSALERSFDGLFLAEGYASATPRRVADAANVGRSTFYEHFSGQEDLLGQRLAAVLRPLADAAVSPVVPPDLKPALDHFWTNRVMTRSLLAGRARVIAMRALANLLEERISGSWNKGASALSPALAAAQIAGGQLAMLDEWLSGRRGCPTSALASALHASSLAAAGAMSALAEPASA